MEATLATDDGATIAWRTDGPRGAPAMLIYHGLLSSDLHWRRWTAHFSPRYRVIRFDYRGHARSPVPKDPRAISLARYADDGHAVLRAAGEERAIVCGLSMGAQVALEHARRHPDEVRALVLICGTAGRPLGRIALSPALTRQVARGARLIPRGGFLSKAAFAPLLRTPLGRELAYLTGGALREDRELLDELFADIGKMDLDVVGAELAAYLEHDAWDVLPELRAPVLIVAGGKDQLTPASTAEKMARLAPRATVHVVPGRTHLAQIEAPEEVHAAVDRFLAHEGLTTA